MMDKAAKPLKIFISYGHEIGAVDESGNPYKEPNNESVVLQIKQYLESRGHEVWLDKEKIKEGSDWRKSIYDGVEWSDVALICLSRRAMRPNGVCRDEIAIAMGVRGGNMFPVKLEALEDSEYPAYLLNRQLFMEFIDWRSHWTEDTIDETWLDKNLEALAKSLEEENVWRYGAEMVELKRLLKPWNMNSRLRRLDRGIQTLYNEKTHEFENRIVHKFCGRESLFNLFEEKIVQSGQAVRIESERILWLKKGPGFGKSRFSAELLFRYYFALTASYFIEYNQIESRKPQTFIASIAYQLAQANSSYREKLLNYLQENQEGINLQTGDPQTLFKVLILDLLADEIDGGRATQWILVDALDEATDNGRNEIASLISQNLASLPPWISFFITSRENDDAVNRNFARVTPIDFNEKENDNDIREYIRSEFKGMNLDVQEELVDILQEKSEGTFLYPEMVFRDLQKNAFTIDDICNLPKGVLTYIHSQFERHFGDKIDVYKKEVRPMLGFILTSCEPIRRAVLKYCLGIRRDSELDDRLEMLGTFFIQSGSTDEDTVVPFHKSVIDYCFDKNHSGNFCVYEDEAKEDFAYRGLDLYKTGVLQWTSQTDEMPNTVQRYFLTWLPSHLMNAKMAKETADVLSDFPFLMKRLRFGNVERVILDYILFRSKLSRIFPDSDAYFNAICSNSHLLRRNCDNNPTYKIMLQIAAEIADDCPVTQAAERWLNPKEGVSPCDWFWFNKVRRPSQYQPSPAKLVMEDAGSMALILSNGDALSWRGKDANLRIWDLETGMCKAVLTGHIWVKDAMELRSGDILSWSGYDNILCLWAPDGTRKAIMKGHKGSIKGAIELQSGDILSWSEYDYYSLYLWSPDGECKAHLEEIPGHGSEAIELSSGNILSWCAFPKYYDTVFLRYTDFRTENAIIDATLRLWSPDGTRNSVLEGHTSNVRGAAELSSGDILSWSEDSTLRLWSPDGICKAVLEGHTARVNCAKELRSGDILSWSDDKSLRIWSPDGTCKAVLEGHKVSVNFAIELRSGDILSWSADETLRLWSPDGTCKAVLEGHKASVNFAIELRSGDILSWSQDHTLRIWSPDGICKAILDEHKAGVNCAKELRSGNILSWSADETLRIWSTDGACKTVLDGHISPIVDAAELDSGDILSWSYDDALYLWSPDISCKTALEKHVGIVYDPIKLGSGDILSWSSNDHTLRIWSVDGICKAVLEGHTNSVKSAIKLHSGDILSWSDDKTLRLWSPDGTCKSVLEGHTKDRLDAIELRSGDILSWSRQEPSLRLWSSDGTFKSALEGHTDKVWGAIQLSSGDILTCCDDDTLRIWSPDGTCKSILKENYVSVSNAIELQSGKILSWSNINNRLFLWSADEGTGKTIWGWHPDIDMEIGVYEFSSGNFLTCNWIYSNIDRQYNKMDLRLWSPDGTCKSVMEGYTKKIEGAVELPSGDIITREYNTFHLWSHEGGPCKEVIESDNPKFDMFNSLFFPNQALDQFYAKESSWGVELQHDFKPIARWNSPSCHSRFVDDGRICVWYGNNLEFLQLNYGNRMSIAFDQVHQFLAGKIDASQFVSYVPKPKEAQVPKTE